MDSSLDHPVTEEDWRFKRALDAYDEILAAGDRFARQESTPRDLSPMFDLIRDTSERKRIRVCRIEWVDGQFKMMLYDPMMRYDHGYPQVPTLPPALHDSLLLPTTLTRHSSGAQELFHDIEFLFGNLMLSKTQCGLLTYWSIATWFPEFLHFIPRLTITGPRFAADLLFRWLWCVCRRPVLLAGLNSAVLRAIPLQELSPTLLISHPRPSKRTVELLDASDRRGYFVANHKDLQQYYSARCVYLGEDYNAPALVRDGLHIHLGRNVLMSGSRVPSSQEAQSLQSKLLAYRVFNRGLVGSSRFLAHGLSPELCAVAQQLGAAIVDDHQLQSGVLGLLKEQHEQNQADQAFGLSGMVLQAVLFYCHQSERQQVLVRELAVTVNDMYKETGESRRVSNETVGHTLKNVGLYTRRLGSSGRGLTLDKATRSRAHSLAYAQPTIADGAEPPACGYCHQFQVMEI
jgi:hypothetical protein